MQTQVYQIRALTNLHPGSGDADYGVVDKLVQRDPITRFPTIHMSAVKGALREFFKNNPNIKDTTVINIFGSEPKADSDKVQQGKLRFISAELIAIPKISEADSGKAYHLCYEKDTLEEWEKKVALFDSGLKISIEENQWTPVSMEVFKEITEELPVVARNHLDNGESQNLWYEEFVPRETLFAVVVQGPADIIAAFEDGVKDQLVQIGGNATVGYGYCLFTLISAKS